MESKLIEMMARCQRAIKKSPPLCTAAKITQRNIVLTQACEMFVKVIVWLWIALVKMGTGYFSPIALKWGGEDITVLEKVAEGNKANPGLKKMSLEDS